MFVPESKFRQYTPERLKELIDAASVDNTILGSDLGQVGNCWPARGFRNVICVCLALGYSDASIKKMIAGNPAKLLGLDPA
jgi:predicted TIM-barrel fold metal-dependent hydrolase